MELRHLRALAAVARHRHFSRAASELHVAQPALSRTITQLEEELGLALIDRTSRPLRLTEAGRAFQRRAEDIISATKMAEIEARRARDGSKGSVIIGFNDEAALSVLPRVIQSFRRRYPDIDLRLVQSSTSVIAPERGKSVVSAGRLDIGFCFGPAHQHALGSLTVKRLPMVAAISRRNPLSKKETLTLANLRDQAFVLGGRDDNPRLWRFLTDIFEQVGFVPNVAQQASLLTAQIGLVAANVGIGLLPMCWSGRTALDGVALIPLLDVPRTIEMAAVWDPKDMTPALGNFVDVVRRIAVKD